MIVPIPAALAEVADAVAAPAQPGASFAALQTATGRIFGHRLFTIMRHDAVAGLNRRVHSSDPVAYPLAGAKPVDWAHPWAQRVLVAGFPWIGSGEADIAWAYPDHAKILALGLHCAMNLPVRWNGRTIGTLNLLDGGDRYRGVDPGLARIVAGLAVAPLLGMDAG